MRSAADRGVGLHDLPARKPIKSAFAEQFNERLRNELPHEGAFLVAAIVLARPASAATEPQKGERSNTPV
jgi:hypothetical protein